MKSAGDEKGKLDDASCGEGQRTLRTGKTSELWKLIDTGARDLNAFSLTRERKSFKTNRREQNIA